MTEERVISKTEKEAMEQLDIIRKLRGCSAKEILSLTQRQSDLAKKFLEIILESFFEKFPQLVGLRLRLASLGENYQELRENNESEIKILVKNLVGDARGELFKKKRKEENRLGILYLENRNKVKAKVVDFLVANIENPALSFLMAYTIGILPAVRDFRSIYKGDGIRFNRKMQRMVKKLGFEEFFADGVYSDNDKYYGYTKDAFGDAEKRVILDFSGKLPINQLVEFVTIPDQLLELEKEANAFAYNEEEANNFLLGCKMLSVFGYDADEVSKTMLWLFAELEKSSFLRDLKLLPKDGVAVLLWECTFTKRGPGVEKGLELVALRNDVLNRKSEYFQTRSPFSEKDDCPEHDFETCSIERIDSAGVEIKLVHEQSSKDILRFFPIAEVDSFEIETLGKEDNERIFWMYLYETRKNELLEKSYLPDARMSIVNRFSSQISNEAESSAQIPFVRPVVTSQHMEYGNS